MKILKKNDYSCGNYAGIWAIVEYERYPPVRDKTVGKTTYRAGIYETIKIFGDFTDVYKILIITTDSFEIPGNIIEGVGKKFDMIVLTSNKGLDFGAYQRIIYLLIGVVDDRTPFILSNSSFVPPSQLNIRKFIDPLILNGAIIGTSFGYGPRYLPLKPLHLQTFFLMSTFGNLRKIFDRLGCFESLNKRIIILFGEIRLSLIAFKLGLKLCVVDGRSIRVFYRPVWRFFAYDHRIDS